MADFWNAKIAEIQEKFGQRREQGPMPPPRNSAPVQSHYQGMSQGMSQGSNSNQGMNQNMNYGMNHNGMSNNYSRGRDDRDRNNNNRDGDRKRRTRDFDDNNSNKRNRYESTPFTEISAEKWAEMKRESGLAEIPWEKVDPINPSPSAQDPRRRGDPKKKSSGIDFSVYDNIPVTVLGGNNIPPIEHFNEASFLHPLLLDRIRAAEYSTPTPIQKYALPVIGRGRDLMASAQTGSGKTAAYLFPIISQLAGEDPKRNPKLFARGGDKQFPVALILAPTRELAIQIHEEAVKFTKGTRLRSQVIYGGAAIYQQIRSLRDGCHLCIATPGRLVDMVERGKLGLENVTYLCLDEADRMLDMGFEPQIRDIVERRGVPPARCYATENNVGRQTVMFSATFPKEIQRLASDFLDKDYVRIEVGRVGSTAETITQVLLPVQDLEKFSALRYLLAETKGFGNAMVFVKTKKLAEQLSTMLDKDGFNCESIHGDLSQSIRESVLKGFRSGRIQFLICTDVAARGLDIENVGQVINYDMPDEIDSYVHRIGRTGRAGAKGIATAFFTNEENVNMTRDLVNVLEEAKQGVPRFVRQYLDISRRRPSNNSRNRRGGGGGGRDRFFGGGGGGRGGGDFGGRDKFFGGGGNRY